MNFQKIGQLQTTTFKVEKVKVLSGMKVADFFEFVDHDKIIYWLDYSFKLKKFILGPIIRSNANHEAKNIDRGTSPNPQYKWNIKFVAVQFRYKPPKTLISVGKSVLIKFEAVVEGDILKREQTKAVCSTLSKTC